MAAGGGCCDVFLWWLWVAMLGDAGADPVFFQEGGGGGVAKQKSVIILVMKKR